MAQDISFDVFFFCPAIIISPAKNHIVMLTPPACIALWASPEQKTNIFSDWVMAEDKRGERPL